MTGTPTAGRLNSIAAPWGDTIIFGLHDRAPYTEMHDSGTLRQREIGILSTVTPKGGTVLDIGAGIGYLTCLFARLVGPDGHVYAFERNPRTSELLRANIRTNGHRHARTAQRVLTSPAELPRHTARQPIDRRPQYPA
jgi:predicted methyltransferase